MAELDLCDIVELEEYELAKTAGEVSVEILNKGGEFSSIFENIPVEKNLITIAVKKYMHLLGRGGHFVFSVSKNIPSGAGLGGGSSNAAAALKIISELFHKIGAANPVAENNLYANDYLLNAASATGSDVPFFLKGGFAFIEARGEVVLPADITDDSSIILVNNGIHVNTGSAYESLKKPVSDISINCSDKIKSIISQIDQKSEWKGIFRNDFEESIFGMYPQIGLVKEKLYENGAFFASMTGSGSTVFGLFENEDSAKNVQKILEISGNKVYFAKFRSRKN